MRQWVRNAAPGRAAGVRGARGGSTCPRPDRHPRGCGSRNSGRQEMNGDRGVGARRGPAREGEGVGRKHLPPGSPRDSGRAPEAPPGRPLREGLTDRGRGRAEAAPGPRGSSPPRCHVPPALRLRDRRAPGSGAAGPGHIGMARGRPARDRTRGGRASGPRADPPPGLGIPETVPPPPSPAGSSSSPARRRGRPRDVTAPPPPPLPASGRPCGLRGGW